jgi:catechol 2,3-dioxygenase-like lactoylglutathione lyase family enzyme
MLTDGFNHVAVVTKDLDRFIEFYGEVFGAHVRIDGAPGPDDAPPLRMAVIDVGPHSELNVFEMPDNPEAARQTPMFGRGRLDHLALQAESMEAFEEIRRRLIARGAADEFVTDFGKVLSVFFRDPDGLECEVCVSNPDWVPGTFNPPGTPSARYVS